MNTHQAAMTVERADGTKEWYEHGDRHRGNGLPAIERADGRKAWYRNGQWIGSEEVPGTVVQARVDATVQSAVTDSIPACLHTPGSFGSSMGR